MLLQTLNGTKGAMLWENPGGQGNLLPGVTLETDKVSQAGAGVGGVEVVV